jgi:hypothetical protein
MRESLARERQTEKEEKHYRRRDAQSLEKLQKEVTCE